MRRLLWPLIVVGLVLNAPVFLVSQQTATGTFSTAGKTAIGNDDSVLTDGDMRLALLSSYTCNAAHDFMDDVQANEISDTYYVKRWPSGSRLQLVSRTDTGNVFAAQDVVWYRLANVTVNAIVLHSWPDTAPESTSVSGAALPIYACWQLTTPMVMTGQPLYISWGGLGTPYTGTVINHSDANPANWTLASPTVCAPTMTNVTASDALTGSAFMSLTWSGSVTSGTECAWRRYQPENPGNVIVSNWNPTSNLHHVVFKGFQVEGRLSPSYPTSVSGTSMNGCDFCLLEDHIGTPDLRPDRGREYLNYRYWNGATSPTYGAANTYTTTQPFDAGEDKSASCLDEPVNTNCGTATPSGGQFGTGAGALNLGIIGSRFSGYRNGGGMVNMPGGSAQIYDTLFTNTHDAIDFGVEYALVLRSVTAMQPNHSPSLTVADYVNTIHFQDHVNFVAQDGLNADINLNGGTLGRIFVWHSVLGNTKGPGSAEFVEGGHQRWGRVTRRAVMLDNITLSMRNTTGEGAPFIDFSLGVLSAGRVVANRNTMVYWRPIINPQGYGSLDDFAGNLAKETTTVANMVDFTDTSKVRVTFTTARDIPSGTLVNMYILGERATSTGPSGNMLYRLETDSGGSPSGTIIHPSTCSIPASNFGTGVTLQRCTVTTSQSVANGATLHLIVEGDSTYDAAYVATPTVRNRAVTTILQDPLNSTSYRWDGSQWVALTSGIDIGYRVGASRTLYTTGSAGTANSLFSMGANDSVVTNATPTAVFTNMPTYPDAGCPSLGTLANTWCFRVFSDIDTVRNWFRVVDGSASDGTASDGLDRGLTFSGDAPSNTAPNAAAGDDQTIASGATASLTCVGSDNETAAANLTFGWSQVSGAAGSFSSTTTAATVFNPPAAGTFVLRCTVTDEGALTDTDDVTVIENAASQPPTVDAGVGGTIPFGGTFSLDATVDDPDSVETVLWTQESGAGTATFGSDTSVDTTVTFTVAGTYVLKLTATDGVFTVSDTVTVVMNAAVNQAPFNVNAGANQTVELTGTANISCTAQDDGLPTSTLTFAWTEFSGPMGGDPTFASSSSASTTATFNVAGTYVLRCTVSDSEPLSGTDDVQITVQDTMGPTNVEPTVNAGADQSIFINACAELRPTVSDDGLTIPLRHRWDVTAGPSQIITNGWRAPSGIPYISNTTGNGISLSVAHLFPSYIGLTENARFDLRSGDNDSVNTHIVAWKTSTGGTFTYVGESSVPIYKSSPTQEGPTVAVTPVSGIQANDLVIIVASYAANSVTLAMSETDGQSWNALTNVQHGTGGLTSRIFWADYSGASGKSPSVTVTAGMGAMIVRMFVYRPSGGDPQIDVSEVSASVADSDPEVITGISPTQTGGVVLAVVASSDDNRYVPISSGVPIFGSASDGSGGGMDQPNVSVCFPYPGSYTVTLTVYDGEFTVSDSLTVTAEPFPVTPRRRRRF